MTAASDKLTKASLLGVLGIVYGEETAPSLSTYMQIVRETVSDLGCHLTFEPGRWMPS